AALRDRACPDAGLPAQAGPGHGAQTRASLPRGGRVSEKVIGYAERASFVEVEYPATDDHALLASLLATGVRSVLEIPCDTGRNTLFLARAGVRLVAVDREPVMIERLAERLVASGDRAAVELRVGDMCDLDLGERFDLIIVQREGFQLIVDRDDAARALRGMARHLA